MATIPRRWFRGLQAASVFVLMLVAVSFFVLPAKAEGAEQPDERLRKITVIADGKSRDCFIGGKVTVAEQLEKLGLGLEQMDTVEPASDALLREGDVVRVNRRRIQQETERGVIPFETQYTYSPDIAAGDEVVYTQGENGYGERVYDVLYVDGVEEERTLVRESLEKEPVTEELGTGWRSPLISPLNFDWKFCKEGEPIGATKVFRNQRSSAYSARAGAKTASGRNAVVGHVAVNPNVIPYGSKLFIQSEDGRYIYGYCVAADTGLALMDGRVAVDIFYDTYEESVQHGIQWVDIFVLETPEA